MKWITREHVHVDRVACPWLIKRFVDRDAEFVFCLPEDVEKKADELGATTFDTVGSELGHHGDKCSFDAIIEKYGLKDEALLDLAAIVRAADTESFDTAPESIGLGAIADGSMMIVKDDREAIEKGAYVYDSLYTYCKLRRFKERYAEELEKMNKSQKWKFLRGKVGND